MQDTEFKKIKGLIDFDSQLENSKTCPTVRNAR